jgi:hypothetical protein
MLHRHLIVSLVPALVGACGAVGEDEVSVLEYGGNSATLPGVGTVDCDVIPVANSVGRYCDAEDGARSRACGDGAACVVSRVTGEALCRQLCVPGACGDLCDPGSDCAQLTVTSSSGSTAYRIDVDGDGFAETVTGACFERLTTTIGDNGPCGEAIAGRCTPGTLCVRLPGAETGSCVRSCDDGCGDLGAFARECVATNLGRLCLVPCEPAANDCPTDLTCRSLGGRAYCSQ